MNYLWLTIKHKWFVLYAGREFCSLWRLIKHDWTKFLTSELPHYQRQFFGKKDDPEGFIRAWIHHQNSNDHHWEYWIPRTGHNRCTTPYPDNMPIPMPMAACEEMVADWLGASRAYTGKWPTNDDWPWMKENASKLRLHDDTRYRLSLILTAIGLEHWTQLITI